MSEDIEMTESSPSINPLKRKGVIQGEFGFGQDDSHSVGEDAEPIEKRRRVESENAAGNPSPFEMVDEPSAHPSVPFGEDAEELQGNLLAPVLPILSGGYANIYLGIWRSPEGTLMDVAVKTLKAIRPTTMSCRPDPIELHQRREKRLKREVAVWTRLIHPNVHPLLGFRTRPEPCLVSPWCQNGNLVNYLDNNPSLSRSDKLQLLVQTARGLAFLHSRSPPICHADIKPENVLVNDLCEAVLSDFGLSRVIQELDASTGFTTGDGPKGSQNYMAPELFEEENSKPTLETDVYAFGGLALAVMSGSPPFAQIKSPAKVLFRIVNGMHPKPEEHPGLQLNDPLWFIILLCWDREPRTRPTISDVAINLREQKKTYIDLERRPPLPNSAQSDFKPLQSVVQPGSTVQGPLPDSLFGDIEISPKPSAQGADSDIYRALLQQHGVVNAVCVKVLRKGGMHGSCADPTVTVEERFERRIRREAVIWTAAKHPNVLPFLGYRMVEGRAWFISPWVSNGNLAAYLGSRNVSKLEKLKMMEGASTGLAYLHGLEPSIAHGDLKPENILILDDLTAALCDFGTSRVVVDLGIHTGMTTAGTAAGTAGYQARELIIGESLATPASDVYAMAGVILATLSGKVPFYQERTQSRVVIRISMGQKCDPGHHPELPANDPLWELLSQCWEPEPVDRPSANEVIQNLQSAIQREVDLPPPYTEGSIEVDSN